MLETATRRGTLSGVSLPNRVGEVVISDAGFASRFAYRGASELVSETFGVALPTEPMRAAGTERRAALWLGPDEWLLIADEDAALEDRLGACVSGKAASLVDVSHRNVGLMLSGPRAMDVLATGCPLDLDQSTFPVGMCARTIFAKAEVILWRQGEIQFRLECWRSLAPYVVGLLNEAVGTLRR